ncbi:ROK family transcriptional regulator [Amycolatopsis sp. NPDC051903]|uniref:ROK family transcriptional regulator n=1 Tax=Amycolatopsis sp. NPDC051903 TaxID=3363936 RepID=UPI00378F832C
MRSVTSSSNPLPGSAPVVEGKYGGLVLRLLRTQPGLSRSRLSEITGLSPTTVTKAVTPLIASGYVEETGSGAESRIGRPAIGLRLVPDAVAVCGVQIGVGTVQAALVDAVGATQRTIQFTFPEDRDAGQVMTDVAERVRAELLETAATEVIALGVGAPGPVDAERRVNLMAVNLGWRDVPMARILERVCGRPATVEHNVQSMALAENRFGQTGRDIAFVHARTGVGLGLVLRGQLFAGGRHGVSELGHLQLVGDGELCACGAHGCLETVASEPALARRLAAVGHERPGHAPLSAIDRAAIADPALDGVRTQYLGDLATGLASVVNLFNPELIVVGGMLANASDVFLGDLATATRERVFPLLRESFQVRRTSFGDNAGTVGAAATALEQFFYTAPADREFSPLDALSGAR